MGKLFGTDGIRGIPWNYPFTPEFIRKIAFCATRVLSEENIVSEKKAVVFLGMDTRASAQPIKKCLTEGFCAGHFHVVNIGIIPTPAIAYLVKRENANFGVVISASHNPPEFNGIKFFGSDGKKLSDELENKIEDLLLGDNCPVFKKAFPHLVKKDYSTDYENYLLSTLPKDFNLKGVRLVLDCANGAAYKIAPRIFESLGAKIKVIGNRPDGKNINHDCGALHTKKMAETVTAYGAYCGMSFDGDADRCILSDDKGMIMDGDDIIALAAPYLKNQGRLTNDGVVLTQMSNCGLVKYLNGMGIKAEQVAVGDKNVTEAMEKNDYKIGGETSGHIIFREFAPTGDGILTALQTLAVSLKLKKPLSVLHGGWKRYPQYVKSIKVSSKPALEEVKGLISVITEIEKKLSGRVFVRYSGTEPLLRVLVEGECEQEVKNAAENILSHYTEHSGAVIK